MGKESEGKDWERESRKMVEIVVCDKRPVNPIKRKPHGARQRSRNLMVVVHSNSHSKKAYLLTHS